MTYQISALLTKEGAAKFLSRGLAIAQAVGLPVTSWRVDDPTRVDFNYLAEVLDILEDRIIEYGSLVSLSWAVAFAKSTGKTEWLKLKAWEDFGVKAVEATYASSNAGEGVTLKNTKGGFFPIDGVGDLTFKSTRTGKTYHNTTLGTLSAGASVTFEFIADEGGASSSVGIDEIDQLVTTLQGVEVVSSSRAIAVDEQSPDSIAEQCRASLGALSPNGPPDAYEYVCRNSDLTGVTDISRAKSSGDTDTFIATVYVASATGSVGGTSVAAAQAACDKWATPLCVTALVLSAAAHVVNVSYTASAIDGLSSDFATQVEGELGALLASPTDAPIGGRIARSAIISAVQKALVAGGAVGVSVNLTLPAGDVVLSANQVATLGTVTGAEVVL